jgi:hypothetical protein
MRICSFFNAKSQKHLHEKKSNNSHLSDFQFTFSFNKCAMLSTSEQMFLDVVRALAPTATFAIIDHVIVEIRDGRRAGIWRVVNNEFCFTPEGHNHPTLRLRSLFDAAEIATGKTLPIIPRPKT